MIPRTVWQTWKTKDIPSIASKAYDSWEEKNPKWTRVLSDDSENSDFILKEYGKTEHDLYNKLPKGVMKADFWRYAIIAKKGGIYTDLDTMCRIPIDKWLKPESKFVCGAERGYRWVQWTFGAIPNHPIFEEIMIEMCRRISGRIDMSGERAVHYYTGPDLFSDVVVGYMQKNGIRTSQNNLAFWEITRMKHIGVQILPPRFLERIGVVHLYGGDRWDGIDGYVGWKKSPL